jgi:hypothetical protein
MVEVHVPMKHYIRSLGHSKEFFTCSMVKRDVITNPSHIIIVLLYMRLSLIHKNVEVILCQSP